MNIKKAIQLVIDHFQKDELRQAEGICRDIVKKHPKNVDALHFLGVICFQRKDYDSAVKNIKKALKIDPNFADAWNNLGNIFHERNKLDEAVMYYQKALTIDPTLAKTYYNLGIALQDKEKLDEAISCYQKALELNLNIFGLYNNLGLALQNKGHVDEAITCYQKALELNPQFSAAYNNLGNALKEKGQIDEAIDNFQRALHFDTRYADAHYNLGVALKEKGQLDKAIQCYQKALRINPNFIDAYVTLGIALHEQCKQEESMRQYDRAMVISPYNFSVRFAKCFSQIPIIYPVQENIDICRNRYYEELTKLRDTILFKEPHYIRAAVEAIGTMQPFFLASPGLNNRDLQKIYGELVCKIMEFRYPQFAEHHSITRRGNREPLRVGFVSRFFYRHSVWKIPLSGWIQNLDKKKFNIYCYHTGRRKDPCTEIVKRYSARFIENIYSFEALCQTIHDDALHVLIYPEIGMDPVSLKLAALQLAPVQCTSLGHPDTSGLPTIDYYLSSDLMEPSDGDAHYTEELIRLPNLGFCYTPLEVPQMTLTRQDFGLQSHSVIFLCSHALFTHLPQYDFIYPKIAAQIGTCQFVFIAHVTKAVTEQFHVRIKEAFTRTGLNADDYVIMLPRLDPGQYHTLNCLSDVFLDTIGWSANNSTFEAIACNIPVVTMPGQLMRRRHCAAILTMMGMKETIASSLDEYIDIAVRLGKDADWRAWVSEKIKATKHLLYNDKTCITALEDFLERVVKEQL